VEVASYGLPGAGTDGRRGGMGSRPVGRAGETQRWGGTLGLLGALRVSTDSQR